jgi:hypothetical protein
MIKALGKSIRKLLSKKYLDWAEVLPKFQGGAIHELQLIREHQRKRSSRRFQNRLKPDNASITLNQVRLVVTFQLEDFGLVQRAVGRLFPNSEKVNEFVKDLKKKESSIHASSWNNIGLIVKEKGLYVGETQYVDELPEHINIVHISYHRILPSLACLSFSFYIEEKFSEILASKQNCDYLPPVLFKSINPFKKFPRGYSMGGGSEGAREVVRNQISTLSDQLNNWLEKITKLKGSASLTKSVVEYYIINGNPTDFDEVGKWFDTNRGWLGDYGIKPSQHDSYKSRNLMYCSSSYPNNDIPVYALISFEDGNEEDQYLNLKLDALSVNASLFSTVDTIQNHLEKNRKSGFLQLAKFDTRILKNSGSASRLKRLGVILNRISHEFAEGKHWIVHSLEGIEDLKPSFFNEEQKLRNAIIENIEYRLRYLSKAFEVVDLGLTGYLEVQNIYAMYRLQKWMFVLSLVVTLATIVGVVANWDDLLKLWEKVNEMHNK